MTLAKLPHPIAIGGPTGSGKSSCAIELARHFRREGIETEIIAADSITHYRRFDIGSAKPTAEERAEFPHHLLDILNPEESFTAGDFVRLALPILDQIDSRGNLALIVGGSGFYLKALLRGMASEEDPEKKAEARKQLNERLVQEGAPQLYREMIERDPALASRIHLHDEYRIVRALEAMQLSGKSWSEANAEAEARPFRFPKAKLYCLDINRARLKERISSRAETMLAQGLVAEVEGLLAAGVSPDSKAFESVGYRQVVEAGAKPDPLALREAITNATMKLAKSQGTWFRGQFAEAEWVEAEPNPALEILARLKA